MFMIKIQILLTYHFTMSGQEHLYSYRNTMYVRSTFFSVVRNMYVLHNSRRLTLILPSVRRSVGARSLAHSNRCLAGCLLRRQTVAVRPSERANERASKALARCFHPESAPSCSIRACCSMVAKVVASPYSPSLLPSRVRPSVRPPLARSKLNRYFS